MIIDGVLAGGISRTSGLECVAPSRRLLVSCVLVKSFLNDCFQLLILFVECYLALVLLDFDVPALIIVKYIFSYSSVEKIE